MLNRKKCFSIVFVILCLISFLPGTYHHVGLLFAQNDTKEISTKDSLLTQDINDGPYLFYRGDSLESLWICHGEAIRKSFPMNDPLSLELACKTPAERITIKSEFVDKDKTDYKRIKKFAALSDIHGQHELFTGLLKAHGIIDSRERWSWGKGHLVIVGDIFDRGPLVTESLWFLYRLEDQARAAGGDVHYLLGNHELMVLRGDLRYLNPKYEYVSKKLDISYDQLFNHNSVLGRWIRTKPVAMKINDFIFVHGGFHPNFLNMDVDIRQLNHQFRKGLDLEKDIVDNHEMFGFLYKKYGPVWYRGFLKEDSELDPQIPRLLKKFKGTRFVVGHTSMDSICSFHESKIIAVDSSIKKGQSGEIFIWENNQLFRGTLSGERIPLQ